MLKRSPQTLFRLAQARAVRQDLGSTASWRIGDGGPRVALIHGFRGDHHGLMGIAGALPQIQFLIPDLPGFGKTPALDGQHDLAGYSAWLRNYLDQLGPVDALLGHSFGSLVVSRAVSDGLVVPRMILQNPITTRSGEQATLANRVADSFYRLGSKPDSNLLRSAASVRAMSVALTKTPNPALRSFIHRQHASYFSGFAENRVVVEGYQAARNANVLDYCEYLPERLLIIAGERDRIAPLGNQKALAQLTAADLKVIPKVGHLTHYETPVQVASHIAEFMES